MMKPKTSKWLNEIDGITQQFAEAFQDLDSTQLNWKPNGETWSIGQIIDHIIVINKTYYPVLAQVRAGTYSLPWIARFDFMVSAIGKIILNGVKPEAKRKVKTFPIWQPSSSEIAADIVHKFAQHQEELKQLVSESEDLVTAGTIISSPANRYVVYKLETAFDIIITHEQRHFLQAQALKNSVGFPA